MTRAAGLLLMVLVGAGTPAGAAGQAAAPDPVDALASRGQLQEAAWAARAAGDTARADRLLERLEAVLRAPARRASPLAMDSQGLSYTFRLDHGQGVESIFKVDGSDVFCRECGADREVASYRVDRLLGLDLTPMTVHARIVDAHGDTLTGSTMYFVREATTPGTTGRGKSDALRLLDAAIGNSDRHGSNWLILPDGREVAIDHNRAFDYSPVPGAATCWEAQVDSMGTPGSLGRPLDRLARLPDDSVMAALAGLDPALVRRFLEMRPRVVARIEARSRDPRRRLPRDDCPAGG